MVPSNETIIAGWTKAPNGRGTSDILVSCLVTIILCCWTSVCPNVPALSDSRLMQLRDKFNLTCIGLLGPEFLLGIAIGQRTSARRSVKKFRKGGFQNWTLAHAFFADMGGFLLQAPDMPMPIPLDAEQVLYLVQKNHIKYPTLSSREIDDKNKSDRLARLLTVGQALWFLVSSIARAIQGLNMTTLELTTLSFIVMLFATSYCWLHKPSDVSRPVILNCESSIEKIRSEFGLYDPNDYRSTPLDFISREYYVLDLVWVYYVNLLQAYHIPLFSRPIRSRPHNRNRSDKFLRTELDFEVFGCIFILMYSITFMCSWNFYFPTEAERILFRCASVFFLVYGVIGGGYMWIWHLLFIDKHIASRQPTREWSSNNPQQDGEVQNHLQSPASEAKQVLLNDDPYSNVPNSLFIPVTLLCGFYCIFRGYILIEDFIGLRAVPASTYDSVLPSENNNTASAGAVESSNRGKKLAEAKFVFDPKASLGYLTFAGGITTCLFMILDRRLDLTKCSSGPLTPSRKHIAPNLEAEWPALVGIVQQPLPHSKNHVQYTHPYISLQ